jgi:hypothetical protein
LYFGDLPPTNPCDYVSFFCRLNQLSLITIVQITE